MRGTYNQNFSVTINLEGGTADSISMENPFILNQISLLSINIDGSQIPMINSNLRPTGTEYVSWHYDNGRNRVNVLCDSSFINSSITISFSQSIPQIISSGNQYTVYFDDMSFSSGFSTISGPSLIVDIISGETNQITIENSAGGNGLEIGDISLSADQQLTLHSIGRDQFGNFAEDANVNWAVNNSIGAFDSDSINVSNVTFNPSVVGLGSISTSTEELSDNTGIITITGGAQSYLKIRDASGGAGSEVGDVTMTTDESLTLYAAVYDADNNYLQDVSVDWTNTGNLDAVSSSGSSFTFDPSTISTTGTISISSGSLVGDATGTITVNGGNQSYLKIRDASGGAGVEVGDVTMTTDESLTLYAAVYDADNNYLQDVSVDWTNTGNLDAVSWFFFYI